MTPAVRHLAVIVAVWAAVGAGLAVVAAPAWLVWGFHILIGLTALGAVLQVREGRSLEPTSAGGAAKVVPPPIRDAPPPPEPPLLRADSRQADIETIAKKRARDHANRIPLRDKGRVRRLLDAIPQDDRGLTAVSLFGDLPFWPGDELRVEMDPPWPDAIHRLRDAYTLTYFKTFHARLNARVGESQLDRKRYEQRVEMGREAARSMSPGARRKAMAKAKTWGDDELADVEPYERGWLVGLRESLSELDKANPADQPAARPLAGGRRHRRRDGDRSRPNRSADTGRPAHEPRTGAQPLPSSRKLTLNIPETGNATTEPRRTSTRVVLSALAAVHDQPAWVDAWKAALVERGYEVTVNDIGYRRESKSVLDRAEIVIFLVTNLAVHGWVALHAEASYVSGRPVYDGDAVPSPKEAYVARHPDLDRDPGWLRDQRLVATVLNAEPDQGAAELARRHPPRSRSALGT
jgi:hypothetical protein